MARRGFVINGAIAKTRDIGPRKALLAVKPVGFCGRFRIIAGAATLMSSKTCFVKNVGCTATVIVRRPLERETQDVFACHDRNQ
jgi:hypothetical protein